MERVLSIGGRLQKLIKEAEMEAERKVEEAQNRAKDMISQARTEADNRRARAQRGYDIEDLIQAEEEKATKEAAKVLEDYRKRADAIKKTPEERFEEAVNLVLREALPG
ncbi:hypothetical protein AC482_00360 [miscellaneous Crenarchaeota group-15 archaeon DG-45]|uniref:Uncharacterized protein n=1 Tax=miscellaneous Crenarchaeota group-15 archaeon DG-45 TaxID=1685127 RepID=A0A0M0BT72_9ARCH|nr:MAG: hypothetical protein AC482_00360 [miscellaneous Crenarchaeota group-15 archaeon DG-45]